MGLFELIFGSASKSDVFDFEKDYKEATSKLLYKDGKGEGTSTFIGKSPSKKNVFIPNKAKHVFICGTTGSGKTIAISNFIKSGLDYDYPMLIVDGKGDTDSDSLLEITKKMGFSKKRKIYVINLNDPKTSDKYNPFKNTSSDVIKDMLINMTEWSEPHYKYNTERYIQRLCKMLSMMDVDISLGSLTHYLSVINFIKLSKDLSVQQLISKEEHVKDIELAKISGSIAESAAARFATIKESELGQIFDSSGIDIYTALKEKAIILFILNPLLYPEMSPLIGNLIVIDSKKAVSNFYTDKKERIFYILDEINTYATASLLDLVNKSRSANITCILATQSLSDLDNVTNQFKEQVIENCNNYIVLRQNSSVNAESWSNIIGTRQTMQATYQIKADSGNVQSTDLGSLRKTREYIYHPDDIKLLETGNAIFVSRDKMKHSKIYINKPF
ncbi:MAG: type IV secretion system DNA-binding domain-containing protein [Lachnospiraceae bacterium]|nr:type IV secretion system DNA-binding domain-containing protein [Lachnospiraceae bacterium]